MMIEGATLEHLSPDLIESEVEEETEQNTKKPKRRNDAYLMDPKKRRDAFYHGRKNLAASLARLSRTTDCIGYLYLTRFY